MKKRWICAALSLLLGVAILTGGVGRAAFAEGNEGEIAAACKAAYLMDDASGVALYAREETKRLPIASMCKIMTLLLALEAADAGELDYQEEIVVSERAAGMGGSQVFLGAGLSYCADELLKSIAVCSANDSCVAIAERLSGSESAFCDAMNRRAKELGAENTLFANCTGLPKDPQYSCAKDVALMLRALLEHEKYHEYSRIWLEDFAHPDGRTTQMTNTNKLIRQYNGCDGGKTGFTNEAGFCLASCAKRNQMQVIAVVIGAPDSEARFAGATSLFDSAFDNFESEIFIEEGIALAENASVRGSRVKEIRVAPEETLSVVKRRGAEAEYTLSCLIPNAVAPVMQGEKLGEAILFRDGVEIGHTTLVALDEAPRYTWGEAYREGAKYWNIV